MTFCFRGHDTEGLDTMKRAVSIVIWCLSMWPPLAISDSLLITQWVNVRFYADTEPKSITVVCFLGDRDLARIRDEDLRVGSHGITGVAWDRVPVEQAVGYVKAQVRYDCTGKCLTKYYACLISNAEDIAYYHPSLSQIRDNGIFSP
jgi:hypothetical protein